MCCILTSIIFLITVIACVMSWVPGVTISFIQLNSFILEINKELGEKAHNFMKNTLSNYKNNAMVLKREYESGLVNVFDVDSMRKRLFSQSKTYQNSFVSFAFSGIPFGDGEMYLGVSRELKTGKTDLQDEGSVNYQLVSKINTTHLFEFKLDPETGKLTGESSIMKNYKVSERDWWIESIRGSYDTGMWGTPYYNLVAGMVSTFFSVPICNNTISQENPTYQCKTGDAKIGIIKNNINLQLIDNFMKSLLVPYDGFALVIESNGNYVGSSFDGFDVNYQSRFNVETIQSQGIGDAIKRIKQHNNPLEPYKFDQRRMFMGYRYLIGVQPFNFDNMEWTIVFYYNFLTVSMYLIIYSCITVMILLMLLCTGFIASNFIAALFYLPLHIINKRFKKIAHMDLSFKKLWSPITEIHSIYSNLERMKLWLIEYRSFLPQHIQEQYEDKTSSSGSYHLGAGSHNKSRFTGSNFGGNKAGPATVVPLGFQSQDDNDTDDLREQEGGGDMSLREELESSLADSTVRSNNAGNFGGGKGPRAMSAHDLTGKKNANQIKKFQLGLKRRKVSCLLFEISNFQEVIDSLESSEDVQKEVSTFLTFLREIARSSQGFLWSFSSSTHCMFWNVNLFKSDKKNLERCLNTAIRTQMSLSSGNLKVTMVLGEGMAHFGNVQTGYQMKEFQVIAPFIEDMKKLDFFALDFTVSIVFDSTVMNEMKKRKVSDKFVWRPIDNFVIKEGDDPMFLYELVGHSNYRIENNPLLKNLEDVVKYKEFGEVFELVHKFPKNIAKVSEAQERLTAIRKDLASNDMAFYLMKSRIEKILDGSWTSETLISYYQQRIRRPVKEEQIPKITDSSNNNSTANFTSSVNLMGKTAAKGMEEEENNNQGMEEAPIEEINENLDATNTSTEKGSSS